MKCHNIVVSGPPDICFQCLFFALVYFAPGHVYPLTSLAWLGLGSHCAAVSLRCSPPLVPSSVLLWGMSPHSLFDFSKGPLGKEKGVGEVGGDHLSPHGSVGLRSIYRNLFS